MAPAITVIARLCEVQKHLALDRTTEICQGRISGHLVRDATGMVNGREGNRNGLASSAPDLEAQLSFAHAE
jgi:hypothetical protein